MLMFDMLIVGVLIWYLIYWDWDFVLFISFEVVVLWLLQMVNCFFGEICKDYKCFFVKVV